MNWDQKDEQNSDRIRKREIKKYNKIKSTAQEM